ncbi:hypothetical protein [Vibrio phage J14]|nr:hypothetical protein [Vibrio phage J14]
MHLYYLHNPAIELIFKSTQSLRVDTMSIIQEIRRRAKLVQV